MALKVSCTTRKPVRVVRGFKSDSDWAPADGYRYDGLYTIEKAWREKGKAGYLVCKYVFKRLPDQPPIPRREGTLNLKLPRKRKDREYSPLPDPKYEGASRSTVDKPGESSNSSSEDSTAPASTSNSNSSTSTSDRRPLQFESVRPAPERKPPGRSTISNLRKKVANLSRARHIVRPPVRSTYNSILERTSEVLPVARNMTSNLSGEPSAKRLKISATSSANTAQVRSNGPVTVSTVSRMVPGGPAYSSKSSSELAKERAADVDSDSGSSAGTLVEGILGESGIENSAEDIEMLDEGDVPVEFERSAGS